MDHKERVPDAVARRLPGYYRNLRELETEDVLRVSSQVLGKRMGLTASQIRQDINCFGGFGQQGYGYHVPTLKRYIGQILGVDGKHQMVIVGAGNIGSAVINYPSFRKEGFRVQALFDISPERIGQIVQEVPVLPVDELEAYLRAHSIDIIVIATPADKAQEIVDLAAAENVRAIWNFAPVDLSVPATMEIANVHLSDSLMGLSFRLHEREVAQEKGKQWIKE
jgi:AT-rich DNA-binding protein